MHRGLTELCSDRFAPLVGLLSSAGVRRLASFDLAANNVAIPSPVTGDWPTGQMKLLIIAIDIMASFT
jgi:hypothetical protein